MLLAIRNLPPQLTLSNISDASQLTTFKWNVVMYSIAILGIANILALAFSLRLRSSLLTLLG